MNNFIKTQYCRPDKWPDKRNTVGGTNAIFEILNTGRAKHLLFFLPVLNQKQVFNSKIVMSLIKLVLNQKQVFNSKIVITHKTLVPSQKLVFLLRNSITLIKPVAESKTSF